MKFTKEEISLCKQVVEKHRKDITRGDWYVYTSYEKNNAILHLSHTPITFDSLTPLWTISDCLEFFGKQKYHFESLSEDDMCLFEVNILCPDRTGGIITKGGTALGTLLKAVLAMVEEK